MQRRPLSAVAVAAVALALALALLSVPGPAAAGAAGNERECAAMRCAAMHCVHQQVALVALVARLRSMAPDHRATTFQVRRVLHAPGNSSLRPNDTLRLQLPQTRRLRVDGVYLLLAKSVSDAAALRLLALPLPVRCQTSRFRSDLKRFLKNPGKKFQCKANEEYRECFQCSKCEPRCYCKSGFVIEQGKCVPNSKNRLIRVKITPREQRVESGKQVQLSCRVYNGSLSLNSLDLNWYRDDNVLSNNTRIKIYIKKRKLWLDILKTELEDTGSYECRYKDDLKHNAIANLTVNYEPVTNDIPCRKKESYCLNNGRCFYNSGLKELSCRCTNGYMGRRCEAKGITNHRSRYSYTCQLGLSASYYC